MPKKNSDKDVSLIWLLLQGQLPPSVYSDTRFHHLTAAVQAVLLLMNKGESAPFEGRRVWALAKERFNATENLRDLIQAAHVLKPDRPLLEAVQQRLLYEKMLDLVTGQLESGAYNPQALLSLIDKQQSGSAVPLYKLSQPTAVERVQFVCRSGLASLDQIIGGFGEELVIVAAPPKQGKSNLFINLAARQPATIDVLYITVADYGAQDLNHLINVVRPGLFQKKENFFIVDYTSFAATLNDVERAVKMVHTGSPMLTIVDRAEKLHPMGKYDSEYRQHDEIFSGLRRIAKRYGTSLLTDSQYGSAGQDFTRRDGKISSEFLYGDRTMRQSIMDLFIGVRREEGGVTLFLEGRRQGRLPAHTFIACDELGVYK